MCLLPKISIITVVKNGEKHLEKCIKSIQSQTYQNTEYIIVDGQSNDNTISIIKKHENSINCWISEKDSGIYDAMNKGVNLSTGDWILFINSDDYLLNDSVIFNSIPYLNSSDNLIVYGQIIYQTPMREITIGEEWNKVKEKFRTIGMVIPHQATFHSKKLFTKENFNTRFKIAGDYEFILRTLKSHDASYIPFQIAKMNYGGVSNTVKPLQIIKEYNLSKRLNGIKIYSHNWIIHIIYTFLYYYFTKYIGTDIRYKIKLLASKLVS